MKINSKEEYKDFNIETYETKEKKYYGIFQDITEIIGEESNGDIEERIVDKLDEESLLEGFQFDSESDNFCVYADSVEKLKWLIDYIFEIDDWY